MNIRTDFLQPAPEGRATAATALVVAGMHRSGTSALTRVFSLLGAELPKSLMPPAADNPGGFWESANIAALNDEILEHFGGAWDDVLVFLARRTSLRANAAYSARAYDMLASEFSLQRLFVLKEPRICLLLDLWLEAIRRQNCSPCIVIPIRDPLEVGASLSARDGQSQGRGWLLWLIHFLSAELSSRGVPRLFVRYEDVLLDWRRVGQRVEAVAGERFPVWTPAAERAVDAFIDSSSRHFVSPREAIDARSDVSAWVKNAYSWAMTAAGGSEPDTTALDDIAKDFSAHLRVFAPVIGDHTMLARSAARRVRSLESEVALCRIDATDSAEALTRARAEAATARADAERQESLAQTQIAEAHDKMTALSDALCTVREQLAKKQSELRAVLENAPQEKIVQLEHALELARNESRALANEVRDREARIVSLDAELQSAVGAREQLAEKQSEFLAILESSSNDKIAQLERMLEVAQGESRALVEDVRDREARITSLDAELQSAMVALALRDARFEELQANGREVRDNALRWMKAHADVVASVRPLTLQLAQSSEQLRTLGVEYERLKMALETAEARCADLSCSLEAQSIAHEDALNAIREELQAQISMREQQSVAKEELESKLASCEVELANVRDDQRHREETMAQLTAENRRLVARVEEVESSRGALEESARGLALQAVELTARHREAESTLASERVYAEELERSARETARMLQLETAKRVELAQRAEQQADLLRRLRPRLRAARAALWRNRWLLPLSYGVDWLLAAAKVGLVEATRRVRDTIELRASGVFDPVFYLEKNWDVDVAGVDPIAHYVAMGAAEGRDPTRDFSTRWYASYYPDVRALAANPLLHYVRHGRAEGRLTKASDHATSEGGLGGLREGNGTTGIDPYSIRPDDAVAQEASRGEAFLRRYGLRSEAPDWAGAAASLNGVLEECATPVASIVVPVYGQLAHTLNCLDALARHKTARSFEIIVVDDSSPDESGFWLGRLKGIRNIRREKNGGFIAACNDGARLARGRWVVLLNNDTRVVDGWLDALLDHFSIHKNTGLVGSKLLYPDGKLQEAGGIIWRDGSAWNYGRGDDSNRPDYCYARQVDYCSGASIALPKSLWEELGGFDQHYAPAYCEDSDLAMRVRHTAGKEVWYQPLSRVIHYEGVTAGRDLSQGVKAYQVENQRKLFMRWREALAAHRENGDEPWLERDRGVTKRALVVEPSTPTPDQDAGSNTVVNKCRVLQMLGYKVTFVPEDNMLFQRQYSEALQKQGFECAYAPYDHNLREHLQRRGAQYDVIVIFRGDTAYKHIDALREFAPQAPIIFNNMDIHYLRMQRQADLENSEDLRAAAVVMKQRELHVVNASDCTVTPSEEELRILSAEAPRACVKLFPYLFETVGTEAPFSERADVLFLGGYRHAPNADAVKYFVQEILPRLRGTIPKVRFWIAGANPTDEVLKLACSDVIVTGRVDDLGPLFDRCRVFAAPLRYGAGLKGKVVTSMAHGLPCVLTSIAAEGMSLEGGRQVLVEDDPARFADAIRKLYTDQALWERLQREALTFARRAYSLEGAGVRAMREVLAAADAVHASRGAHCAR